MTSPLTHVPVMLEECLQLLNPAPGKTYVDGTLGLAGHSLEIVKRITPGGHLIGLDWDTSMLAEAKHRLAATTGVQITLFHSDYRELAACVRKAIGEKGVNGILLDLGLNNAQITDPTRGISFLTDGPLDMRMDRSRGESAAALLNRLPAKEIERILRENANENWSKKIAEIIEDRRKLKPLETTNDLVQCVFAAIPPAKREKRIHPATRTFQAVRVEINRELDDLESAMREAAETLAVGGVLVVLSYHSGEDRATKHCFRELPAEEFQSLTKKPQTPSDAEVARNPKSRSAKLRAVTRISKPS